MSLFLMRIKTDLSEHDVELIIQRLHNVELRARIQGCELFDKKIQPSISVSVCWVYDNQYTVADLVHQSSHKFYCYTVLSESLVRMLFEREITKIAKELAAPGVDHTKLVKCELECLFPMTVDSIREEAQ